VSATDQIELLSRVPLFSELSSDELERISRVAVPRSFPAGVRVFHEGDHSDACYLVRQGDLRVTREHSDGRAIALATLGPGDLFGFLGNLLYGLVPYKLWEALTDRAPVPRRVPETIGLVAVIALAAMLCATVIGWGLNWIGFHPFEVLGSIVLVNNLVVALALGPFLLAVLYPRVERARLLYRDLLGPRVAPPRAQVIVGVILVVGGTLGAFVAGQAISNGQWLAPWAPWETVSLRGAVGVGLMPILAIVLVGLALL